MAFNDKSVNPTLNRKEILAQIQKIEDKMTAIDQAMINRSSIRELCRLEDQRLDLLELLGDGSD